MIKDANVTVTDLIIYPDNTTSRTPESYEKMFKRFYVGEKLTDETGIIDVSAAAEVHVDRTESGEESYDTFVYAADTGMYFSSSQAVHDTIFEVLAEGEHNRFRIGSRRSKKGRDYLIAVPMFD